MEFSEAFLFIGFYARQIQVGNISDFHQFTKE